MHTKWIKKQLSDSDIQKNEPEMQNSQIGVFLQGFHKFSTIWYFYFKDLEINLTVDKKIRLIKCMDDKEYRTG